MTKTMDISVNDITMPCTVFGEGKKSMIMLPGLSVKNVAFSALIVAARYKLLTDDFTVYILDRRSNIREGYSIADMADDTAAVMHKLGLKDSYVFGASQGGAIGAALAGRHPELVRKLLVASCPAKANEYSDGVFRRWIELSDRKERTELTRDFLSASFSPKAFASFGNVFERVGRTFTDSELEHFSILARSLLGFSVEKDAKRIDCPMLCIGSTEDRVFGRDALMGLAELTGCENYVYTTGCGHSLYDEEDDFVQRVYDFFSENQIVR